MQLVDLAASFFKVLTGDQLVDALANARLPSDRIERIREWCVESHNPSQLLTVAEFASLANREGSGIRVHCQRGTLRAQKKGDTWLIPRSELAPFLAQYPDEGKPGRKRT